MSEMRARVSERASERTILVFPVSDTATGLEEEEEEEEEEEQREGRKEGPKEGAVEWR